MIVTVSACDFGIAIDYDMGGHYYFNSSSDGRYSRIVYGIDSERGIDILNNTIERVSKVDSIYVIQQAWNETSQVIYEDLQKKCDSLYSGKTIYWIISIRKVPEKIDGASNGKAESHSDITHNIRKMMSGPLSEDEMNARLSMLQEDGTKMQLVFTSE